MSNVDFTVAADCQTAAAGPTDWCFEFMKPHLVSLVRRLDHGPSALLDFPDTVLQSAFRVAADEMGSPFALPRDIVFPRTHFPLRLFLRTTHDHGRFEVENAAQLRLLGAALSGDWSKAATDEPERAVAESLLGKGFLQAAPPAERVFEEPGIYRLQHASILFRSERAAVIVDPVMNKDIEYWRWPAAFPERLAVLISHSHYDHFCLATLLQLPKDTLIVTPTAPCSSMLGPDIAALLRTAGFSNVVAAPWRSSITFHDITVRVYPFYGEQPWLTFASPDAALRNWGNTYVVDADGVSTWLLLDAGDDFDGRTEDLCECVLHDAGGSIDFVMSNLRSFEWHPAQIDGSGRYLFCFPRNILANKDLWPFKHQMTLGPEGVARIIERMRPRAFLPYAHWWQERSDELVADEAERALTQMVEQARGLSGTPGDVLQWRPGSQLRVKSGEPCLTYLA